MTEERVVTIELEEELVDLTIITLMGVLEEHESCMRQTIEELQEAEHQIVHKSNPPLVHEAWLRVREDLMSKQYSAQCHYDSLADIVEVLKYCMDKKNHD